MSCAQSLPDNQTDNMRSAALLLVTTLAVTTLGDGPGHHGHHGDHHGAHHDEHGAHHAPHPVANTQKHAPHHAAHPHPQPQQHKQPVAGPLKVQAPRAPRQPVPRPVPVRQIRKPQAALRPRPAHPRPVVRKVKLIDCLIRKHFMNITIRSQL